MLINIIYSALSYFLNQNGLDLQTEGLTLSTGGFLASISPSAGSTAKFVPWVSIVEVSMVSLTVTVWSSIAHSSEEVESWRLD